jgi:hypothetical protein
MEDERKWMMVFVEDHRMIVMGRGGSENGEETDGTPDG